MALHLLKLKKKVHITILQPLVYPHIVADLYDHISCIEHRDFEEIAGHSFSWNNE